MLLSAGSVLVVAQSSSEIPEGLINNPVYFTRFDLITKTIIPFLDFVVRNKITANSFITSIRTLFEPSSFIFMFSKTGKRCN